jgi:hypothetical protein
MIAFFTTLLRLFLQAFRSKRNILTENALLKKENDIRLRRVGRKRVHFKVFDNMKMSRSITVSDRIRGFSNRFRSRVNRRR